MKRPVSVVILTALLLAAGVAPVIAASAGVSPSSQVHSHGVASHWTLGWGTTSPYHVEFYFGDGIFDVWQSTSITGSSDSYTFYPCSTTVFHQDGWNNQTHTWKGYAYDTSTAQEAGGPCAPQP